ncbi:MAG TPA: T9SS type A sorting domain-containing protein [Chryseosolibacter sp.]|nr:T9SS type A sorting domain-containing protein [Chryseosolibacter sp.]
MYKKLTRNFGQIVLMCAMACSEHPDIEQRDATLIAFPSPMLDRAYIRVNHPSAEPAELSVFDPTGKVLISERVTSGEYQYEIDVRDKPEGRYHVILRSATKTVTRILIKR